MTAVGTVGQGRFEGWRVFGAMTVAVGAMALVILGWVGADTDGYRMIIRATARTSLALFLAAFVAAPVLAFRPGEPARWLARNQRYLGLSFAMSHAVHLAAIITLVRTDLATFATLTNPGSIVGGSLGYLVLVVLTVLSFDRVVAALGPVVRARVLTGGSWFLWVLFLITNGGRVPENLWYLVPTVVVVSAALVRIVAWRRTADGAAGPRRRARVAVQD